MLREVPKNGGSPSALDMIGDRRVQRDILAALQQGGKQ